MKYAFCSNSISNYIRTALFESGVDVISVPSHKSLPLPTCSHADMLCFKLTNDTWVIEHDTYSNLKSLIPDGIKVLTDNFISDERLEYPYDIRFNAALMGGFLFCKERYISPIILENTTATVVDVKQGYTKCSICNINEYSFITADQTLKKAADKCGLDALLISPGNIRLKGYNYGFIGGASGIYQNKLYFFGDIRLHPDYKAIHDFIYKRDVEEIILSDEVLCDCGGLLFL